jgi:hypothetical protein
LNKKKKKICGRENWKEILTIAIYVYQMKNNQWINKETNLNLTRQFKINHILRMIFKIILKKKPKKNYKTLIVGSTHKRLIHQKTLKWRMVSNEHWSNSWMSRKDSNNNLKKKNLFWKENKYKWKSRNYPPNQKY